MSAHRSGKVPSTAGILLVTVSVLVSLALCEGALTAFWPRYEFLDPETDEYWKQRLQERLRASDPLNEFWTDAIIDPELGWRMRPDHSSELASHDERGFRVVPTRPGESNRGRILAIGDSFTYGLGVRDEETFAAYLATVHGFEVINAGVNAYGVDQALLLWEREGRRTSVDAVVLGYFVDDFYRNGLEVRDAPKPRFVYDETVQRYVSRGPREVPREGGAGDEDLPPVPSIRVFDALGWMIGRIGRAAFERYDHDRFLEYSRLSNYLLERMKETTAAKGADLIVLIIGHCYDSAPMYSRAEHAIESSCDALGLDCLNVAAAMREKGYAAHYDDNCHFSDEGHRLTADLIASHLESIR